MTRVLLHVGIGKTGTTALQSYLSFNPVLRAGDTTYEYIAISRSGEVLRGEELKARAEASPLKSFSSLPDPSSVSDLEKAGETIRAFSEETGHVPVLSQEDWLRRFREFQDGDYLKRLGFEADVVSYVRPQVEWFQSGWWQWWAWHGQFDTPDQVIEQWGVGLLNWNGWMRQWERMDRVHSINLRLHSGDVVANFADFLKLDEIGKAGSQEVSNPSLGLLGTKLLLTFPGLRNAHDANVDIALSKLIPDDEKAPWVVSPELSRRIIEETRGCNEALAARLPEETRNMMLSDPRWWDPEHYAKREWVQMKDLGLSMQDTRGILETILKNYLPWGKN